MTAFCPSRRAMLVCTACPSRTLATSDTRTTRPSTDRSGRSPKAATVSGLALMVMVISRPSVRSEPEGSVRFCVLTARVMSLAERP